ncbi:HR-like lesion-inducer [Artemisia annua]|uniref:HR-like lesion-inducer n=1 Tax=Artemisia annua TaxID=35608 RepID=A0A2U1L8T4_ARTAN|nr:HR-like lesion-inducer [Artemisia annua]PWA84618.1 HR-like lesion-inducer [Artemisia annua]
MAFTAFIGRLLFASIFILSAHQMYIEFGTDGGPAVKVLEPKLNVFTKLITSKTGIQLPEIDTKTVVQAIIVLKAFGGVGFVFGSYAGALLLVLHQLVFTPVLYDFYNYDAQNPEFGQLFTKFTQNMSLLGALLYFIGMKHKISLRQSRKTPKTKTN